MEGGGRVRTRLSWSCWMASLARLREGSIIWEQSLRTLR
jgi:hypothetical protein